ncbi:MAG TPA: hypothetical protein VF516_06850, partial [Kofleriaceae bacterium]
MVALEVLDRLVVRGDRLLEVGALELGAAVHRGDAELERHERVAHVVGPVLGEVRDALVERRVIEVLRDLELLAHDLHELDPAARVVAGEERHHHALAVGV